MDREEILDQLEKLIKLDVDATHAYDQAIKNMDQSIVRDKLLSFQGDHRRHIDVLSEKMRELQGTPPDLTADFKGFFIKGFTALRSMMGTKGALQAMETNERLTTSTYEKSSGLGWPADIAAIVRSNWADEQRHLSFIREALSGGHV
ncbi:ferritin-like protein of unknown function DUF2383 [Geotalea daltonii FRC-32]|uniref:DUF2383 domain-containing protein n=2 Tax=Geotalea TaxID=2910589 RepID=B9M991_GEODF|nr:ferritin-like protein of unknown function DUF2383 [Geotalea daltonii FRC-32]